MTEVTDADRQAAADLYLEQLGDEDGFAERIRSNTASPDCDSWEQAFARHRIAALEEAAKVADEYVAFHDKHDDGLSGFTHMALGAREVAEEIRALKGPSNA